jgi:S1-C subfamily serine protease
MVAGGLVLKSLPEEGRRAAGVANGQMALVVDHVGEYEPHAAAKKAGFVKGDVVLEYDGRSDLVRETDLIAHALRNRKSGDRVALTVLRAGRKLELELPIQE